MDGRGWSCGGMTCSSDAGTSRIQDSENCDASCQAPLCGRIPSESDDSFRQIDHAPYHDETGGDPSPSIRDELPGQIHRSCDGCQIVQPIRMNGLNGHRTNRLGDETRTFPDGAADPWIECGPGDSSPGGRFHVRIPDGILHCREMNVARGSAQSRVLDLRGDAEEAGVIIRRILANLQPDCAWGDSSPRFVSGRRPAAYEPRSEL